MENISSLLKEKKVIPVEKKSEINFDSHYQRLSKKLMFKHLGDCSPVQRDIWFTHYLYQNWETHKSWLSYQQVADRLRKSRQTIFTNTKWLIANNLLLEEKEGQIIYYSVI